MKAQIFLEESARLKSIVELPVEEVADGVGRLCNAFDEIFLI